jgi:MoaA/NifB/PqqE/SkfB family radical SAM enzyme
VGGGPVSDAALRSAAGGGAGKAIDRSIGAFFWNGVRASLSRPGQARQFARTLRWQAAAAKTRRAWQERGVRVPPIIIFSITRQCNLHCTGCYAFALQGAPETGVPADGGAPAGPPAAAEPAPRVPADGDVLSAAKLESIVAEAAAIGVAFFVIAGGEPLMRPEILGIAGRFPRVVFLLFTNGLLLDEATVARLASLKNVVCLLSLEGNAAETDRRRGDGTYALLERAMGLLRARRLFFGCSLTLTSQNFSTVLDEGYVKEIIEAGSRLLLFAEYTPIDETTEGWALTDSQRDEVPARMRVLRKHHRAVFVAVPWDEGQVGGCLSAGRGFVHISASGDVEPCPFAPYSDVNLARVSLLEALDSPLLAALRAMRGPSESAGGGCALWRDKARVERTLAEASRDPR